MTDYLQWQSELSLQNVFASGESYSYPSPIDNSADFVCLTELKQEKSRRALMLCRLTDQDNYSRECITPSPFNCQTKVNEYGGKPFWIFGQTILFANQADQCLYRQSLKNGVVSLPERVSCKPNQQRFMYTDVIQLDKTHLLAIVESASLVNPNAENISFIGLINTDQIDQAPLILQSGADFYSNLVVDHQAKKIAWVEWCHPKMPWDANQLMVADLVDQNQQWQIQNPRDITLDKSASACQLLFANNGDLYFSADFSGIPNLPNNPSLNYWNIHCYSPSSNTVSQVTQLQQEFGYPHWQYGDHRICQNSVDTLLAIASLPDQDTLYQISLKDHSISVVSEHKGLQSLSSNNVLDLQKPQSVLAVQFNNDSSPDLIRFNNEQIYKVQIDGALHQAYSGQISYAEHRSYSTQDQQTAYGFYYPPANQRYLKGDDSNNTLPPPLIVMVHGGPTARAYDYFDLQKQFWTSRGFAIFDVNHRGSSGYGRHFRDALYGQWGLTDASDIVDGIADLIAQGLAAPEQICIRGKSAGGYAVLRALTEYPEVFCAGACYYGIGNLITLAQTTHKFEKYYTDRLIGESYESSTASDSQSQFFQRSPINHVKRIKSGMIIFQGLQDNIVPPEVAKEMVSALKKAGLEHSYIEFENEGHGFRQVSNNIDAWSKELAFYRKILQANEIVK